MGGRRKVATMGPLLTEMGMHLPAIPVRSEPFRRRQMIKYEVHRHIRRPAGVGHNNRCSRICHPHRPQARLQTAVIFRLDATNCPARRWHTKLVGTAYAQCSHF